MHKNKIFIIDFDSTFIRLESLDELADIALKEHPNKNNILAEIRNITRQGMEGTITLFRVP